jgi:outer membrane protein TolC
MRVPAVALLLTWGLAGCAFYSPAPLPREPDLATALPESVKQPLTLEQAASLAIERSPNLLIERRKADVSGAEAYAAGLLPDPQFTAGGDHPTVQGIGLTNAYVLGLSEDLQALLTEPSRAESAEAKQKQAKLDLLWAEWQTIQKVANLAVQKVYAERKAKLLAETADMLEAQSAHSQRALSRHDTTIDVAGSDLSATLDIESQRDAAERAVLTADADLRTELDLAPGAALSLVDPGDPGTLSETEVKQALADVVRKRPDLLALRAGYHAQEEAVRTAILEQFPAISFGFNRASDTTNVQTNGLSVTLNIPIFGSTRAKISTARATRAELYVEYQARLDQTAADTWRTFRALDLARTQIGRIEAAMPELERMAQIGRKAHREGNLAPATYALLETTLATREGELLDLRSVLWSDSIALRTLLAMPPLADGPHP